MSSGAARRGALAFAACLLVPALWWAGRLWLDTGTRAFDNSDPSEQLSQALEPVARWNARGPLGWLCAVASDPGAKPLQSGLLSAAILCGLPGDHVGYELFTGFFVILLMALVQAALSRGDGGLAAGVVFAGFALGSNVALQQALYGGHSWQGQAFLWLAAGLWTVSGPPAAPSGRVFLFGLCWGAALLSSYHMAPMLAALGLAWAAWLAAGAVRERRWPWRAATAFSAGAAAILATLEAFTFAIPKHHYWETLYWQFHAAQGVPRTFRDAGFYFLDLLRTCESPAFAAALGALSLIGGGALARRLKEPRTWPWLVLPAASLAFAQAPSTIKLERTCLPAVIALFPLAGLGAKALLDLAPAKARLPAAVALALALVLFNEGRLRRTWLAFHAGQAIEAVIAAHGGGGPAVIVGPSIPYNYEPGRQPRVGSMADLRREVSQGRRWVLVSDLSPWFWNGFLPPQRFDIPVRRIYDGRTPFFPVPGVESTSFQEFSNEFQYHMIRDGELPFPVENRLYRASDFLAAASVLTAARH